ncbi:MAG: hypothetical protein JWM52_427 [Candidatus Saccharibacteria bacterium]|nr:hypothetical protein [Candidatus Saccharibacteria bacterium]
MRIQLISVKISLYEFIYWHNEFITQLPFELKLTMPPTDKGRRGYSNSLVAKVKQEMV